MAVIHHQVMPDGVPIQMLDEVTAEVGGEDSPPPGLILHTHYEEDGRVHITDVWESQEDFEKFNEEQLTPAVRRVAEAHGVDLSQGPGPPTGTFSEVHGLIRGS